MKTKSQLLKALPGVLAGLIILIASVFGLERKKESPLVVHEWGTFTVLQNSTGDPVAGVNINEEALPGFVHRLAPNFIPESNELAPALGGTSYGTYVDRPPRSKGIIRGFQLAIMRMETPIIYFYPPDGKEMTVDVSVRFSKGWLSEWFPEAKNESPGYPKALGSDKPGSLTWKGLRVGVDTAIPPTDEHVWLAPRAVDSARVQMPGKDQSEQYLFYRGVAQLESPIRVMTTEGGNTLTLQSNLEPEISGEHLVKHIWLADIRPDGKVAFRTIDPIVLAGTSAKALASTAGRFPEDAYGPANLGLLRESMHTAIVDSGLFDDEAAAMLNTWELSYFKSAGMRLFYVLPNAWTNHQLPLEISKPAQVKRVMIGRVELVTREQEALLSKIAAGPTSEPDWLNSGLGKLPEKDRAQLLAGLRAGHKSLADVDAFDIPSDYRAYLKLGRFRDALVLNRSKDPALKKFAMNYGISLH